MRLLLGLSRRPGSSFSSLRALSGESLRLSPFVPLAFFAKELRERGKTIATDAFAFRDDASAFFALFIVIIIASSLVRSSLSLSAPLSLLGNPSRMHRLSRGA
jgi:hypothetical protein